MAETVLNPQGPLSGYVRSFAATRLAEVPELAAVAAAIPRGREAEAAEALRTAYLIRLPDPGRYAVSTDGGIRILRTAHDQLLVLFDRAESDPRTDVETLTKGAFYTVDQTDAFAALDLEGPLARAALERVCPLDLHPAAFGPDHATRTLMEHLAVTILRTGEDAFRLLSARSSALSFLHTIERSLENLS